MGRDLINIRVELDRESDSDLHRWAKEEERSKRLHAKVILRRILQVRRQNPDLLRQLGLAH
jgi:predicted ATPase with chaperone activity